MWSLFRQNLQAINDIQIGGSKRGQGKGERREEKEGRKELRF